MFSSGSPARDRPMLPALSLSRPEVQSSRMRTGPDGKPSAIIEKTNPVQPVRHKFLTDSEWARFAQGVGGCKDSESQTAARPSTAWWPPKGMPVGLYRDIVVQRAKCFYLFHTTSIFRWGLLIVQLFIGASLTALGPFSFRNGAPITVLGAANTIIAGLLALLHNSGLPDRFRHDMLEFERVEDHVREILEGRLAPVDQDLDQILFECFDMFSEAKATVADNLPATYNSRKSFQPVRQGVAGTMSPVLEETSTSGPRGDKSFMTSN